ncbi:hypothetical protein ACLOJK_014980 [Asimina triloba]
MELQWQTICPKEGTAPFNSSSHAQPINEPPRQRLHLRSPWRTHRIKAASAVTHLISNPNSVTNSPESPADTPADPKSSGHQQTPAATCTMTHRPTPPATGHGQIRSW